MSTAPGQIGVTLTMHQVQQFLANARSARQALGGISTSAAQAGQAAESASRGGLLSLKNVLGGYWLSQAAIGMAHAAESVVSFGVKSAASLEQSQIGFTTLLGSANKAKDMLADLSAFAAKTPFELSNLRDTASMMLGFGWSAKQIIPDLTAVGDAMSGLGRGQDDVKGVMVALGQMRQSGRLNAGDVNQLTSRGIAAWQILADKMGKSIPEVRKMSEKGLIPAAQAVGMLTDGMENGTKHAMKFKGMMAAQSLTLSGLASNAKDYASQLATAATVPFMPAMKAALTGLNTRMQTAPAKVTGWMSNARQAGGIAMSSLRHGDAFGAAVNVDRMFGGTGALTGPLTGLIGIGLSVKTIWSDSVVPAFRTLKDILSPFGALLSPLRSVPAVFALLAKHTTAVKVALVAVGLIFAGFKVYRATIVAIRVAVMAWTAVQWILNAALNANPIGLIVLGIAALVIGFIYAYKHSDTFRKIVQAAMRGAMISIGWVVDKAKWLWGWIKKIGSGAGEWLSGMWDGMKSGFKAVVNWLIEKWNWLGDKIGTIGIPGTDIKVTPFPHLPALADGGTATSAGWSMVGERGPELRYLPKGASVIPLPRSPENGGVTADTGPREAVLMVDRVELARAVFRGRDAAVARL